MIVALIPAAGAGTRIGGNLPKQYQLLAGRPLLAYSIEAFAASAEISAIYVVLAPADQSFGGVALSGRAEALTRTLLVGGASRHESVLNGLETLVNELDPADWVLVHDAARPGLTAEMVASLVAALGQDPVGGLLALPVADTLKAERVDGNAATVSHTVDRAGLWQAQTPQMFRLGLLREALAGALQANRPVTDEASAIEALGFAPRLVRGSPNNFKVTYPEDLQLAEKLLKGQ
jgi:2-C-methyl-D-erythritol 4-phosphate cytidylyltransferase